MSKLSGFSPHSTTETEIQATRPFFYILMLVLMFIYGVTVYTSAELREPARLLPFTLLMLIHALLHWYSPWFSVTRQRLVIYFVVQVGLVLLLSWISRELAVILGLYSALAGETFGILEDWKRSFIGVVVYLLLMAFTMAVVLGQTVALATLALPALVLLFVLVYIMLYMQQLHAREEAQQLLDELALTHQQLGEYAEQVETLTLEAERQRMARELHDTLAQGLAGVILQLEALEAYQEKGDGAKAAEVAAQAKVRAKLALADARRAIDDLREQPTTPRRAIEQEVERFTRSTGLVCELSLPDELPLSQVAAGHLVRGVSEGLANVAQHAQASRVWVTVEMGDLGRDLSLTIRDDGVGFDPETIPAGHYGLIGLRERARLVDGRLQVESSAVGTLLTLYLPVSYAEEHA